MKITVDTAVVSCERLLHLFFRSVDPLDAGGQSCDRGLHHATAISVAGPGQRRAAEAAARQASADPGRPVVTPIRDAMPFWPQRPITRAFTPAAP